MTGDKTLRHKQGWGFTMSHPKRCLHGMQIAWNFGFGLKRNFCPSRNYLAELELEALPIIRD